jgi:diguanylate cyclase (GGDEF)-like protein
VDPLTGALNRRGLAQVFPDDGEADMVMPLCVMALDVDMFKQLNDRFGHAVGDEAIRRVAQLLSVVLRVGDAVVRHGGDEFLLVLPGVDLRQGSRIAERALDMIRNLEIDMGEHAIGITASLGVAERREGETRDELIARADAALYEAKEAGRDTIRLSS